MKIIVDADACPVKEQIVEIAKRYKLNVVMVCDTSHVIKSGYAEVVVVDKGRDSADIVLVNFAKKNDIVITQDYGVAAMALAKGSKALGNSGIIYTDFNIDAMLAQRHMSKENRRKGGKFPKHKKRTTHSNHNFSQSFEKLIEENVHK